MNSAAPATTNTAPIRSGDPQAQASRAPTRDAPADPLFAELLAAAAPTAAPSASPDAARFRAFVAVNADGTARRDTKESPPQRTSAQARLLPEHRPGALLESIDALHSLARQAAQQLSASPPAPSASDVAESPTEKPGTSARTDREPAVSNRARGSASSTMSARDSNSPRASAAPATQSPAATTAPTSPYTGELQRISTSSSPSSGRSSAQPVAPIDPGSPGSGASNSGSAARSVHAQPAARAIAPAGTPASRTPFVASSGSAKSRTPGARAASHAARPAPRGTDAHEKAVAAQALRGLAAALRQRGRTIDLRLAPDNLGLLRVKLSLDGPSVQARIDASTDQARDLLLRRRDELRTALESHGLSVERLDIRSTPSPEPAPPLASTIALVAQPPADSGTFAPGSDTNSAGGHNTPSRGSTSSGAEPLGQLIALAPAELGPGLWIEHGSLGPRWRIDATV